MQSKKHTGIDGRVAEIFSKQAAVHSRRSFLHRASVTAFGLLGVSIAKTVGLFGAAVPVCNGLPEDADWRLCGLNGNSICDCSYTDGDIWVLCCFDDGPCHLWHRCRYRDICINNENDIPPGCTKTDVPDRPSGYKWCSSETMGRSYIYCTIATCDETGIGYQDYDDCMASF